MARFTTRVPFYMTTDIETGVLIPVATPRETGCDLACPGEAHRPEVAGNIDNCLHCAPRWGVIHERVVDVEAAFARGQAVATGDLPDFQLQGLLSGRRRDLKFCDVQRRTSGGGSVSFVVVRQVQ